MNEVIGALVPLAAGVAVSPLPVIAVILMLGTPRAAVTGSAFALGWVVGLCTVSALVLVLASDADDADSATSTAVDLARVGLGLLLLLLAARKWRGRPRPGEERTTPAWLAAIDGFSATKSFATGALLAGGNPKNLALTASSAAMIAEAGLSAGRSAMAVGVFVVIGSISVAGPVLFFAVAGERSAGPLAAFKAFLIENLAVIAMVVLILLGANLVGAGYAGLAA